MTLLQLRTKLARYAQRALADFTADGQDLLVEALENARLNAEKSYNWAAQQEQVTVVVQPSGTTIASTIKCVTGAWILISGEPYPLEVRTQADNFLRQSKIRRATEPRRYLGDADLATPMSMRTRYQLIFNGNILTVAPTQTTATSVVLDTQEWMTTYRGAADSYEDWLMIQGHEYLFWQALVELNYFTKNFIPRQEGNLAPPERSAEMALLKLHEADVHKFTRAIYYK